MRLLTPGRTLSEHSEACQGTWLCLITPRWRAALRWASAPFDARWGAKDPGSWRERVRRAGGLLSCGRPMAAAGC